MGIMLVFLRSINWNSNWNLDKSIGIIIGTRTGQSESQSDPGESMSRMIVIRHVHGVNEHIVGDIL